MTDKKINIDMIIGVILSLIFVFFSFSGVDTLERIEGRLYDIGSGFANNENLNPDKVALIEIDDESLDKLGSWPWPRRIIADMIDNLKKGGAKVIGLDIPFDETEHNEGLDELRTFREKYNAYPATSADISLKKWVLDNLNRIETKIDNDSALSKSIKDAGNVILPVYSVPLKKKSDEKKLSDDSFLLKNALSSSTISYSVKERILVDRLAIPIPDLGKSAAGLGQINTSGMDDSDGRSFPAYWNYKGMILPSFPLSIAESYFGLRPQDLIVKDNSISLKDRFIPLVKGKMLIKFREVKEKYSFGNVLNNKKLVADLKGKVVLIEFKDYMSGEFKGAGIETEARINAQLVDNLINSGTVSRPWLLKYFEILVILLIGVGGARIFSFNGPVRGAALASGILLLMISAEFVMFFIMGVWLKTVYMAGCLASVYLVLTLKKFSVPKDSRRDSPDEIRLLGLNYQNQGLLDQAFEKFQRLPLDNDESKGLMYDLGLEYEKKNQIDEALKVYKIVAGHGGYRDVGERISRLRESDKSSVSGIHIGLNESGKVLISGEKVIASIGRYEILGVLGKGSMGLVYKAQDPKINRLVAIKTIRFSDEFDEDVIQEIKQRFFREAEIAGQLSHPSIVTIHDVGEDGDLTYMAMEFLEGEDLDNFITKKNLLSFRRVLDVILKIAEALDYAHKADVIHRDIKPANVMLLKNGNIKVTDFGIAKAISSSRTKTGVILGTPNYMSPEQIMGQKIDFRSDIFSLGVLFYQLITGELPFHGDNLSGLLYQITQIKHPSPRSYNPKIPNICEQILDKALAKDPARRFRSAGEMARVINSLGQRIDQMRIEKASIK